MIKLFNLILILKTYLLKKAINKFLKINIKDNKILIYKKWEIKLLFQ